MHIKSIRQKELNNIVVVVPYYPVGAIIESTNSNNPKTYWGYGTWELFGKGKVTVCIDSSDSDFNKVEKTGGSKYLQKHNHNITTSLGLYANDSQTKHGTYYGNNMGNNMGDMLTINDAGTGNSGNLQPYVVVYRWRRVKW